MHFHEGVPKLIFQKQFAARWEKKHELCLSGQITRVIWRGVACGVWPFDALIDPLYVNQPGAACCASLCWWRTRTHDEMDAISRRRHRKNRLLRQYYTPFCFLWARTHTHAHGAERERERELHFHCACRLQSTHLGTSKWLNDREHANRTWFTA